MIDPSQFSTSDKTVNTQLTEHFVPIDNYPRDYDRELQIIKEQKASLLLCSKLDSPELDQVLSIDK